MKPLTLKRLTLFVCLFTTMFTASAKGSVIEKLFSTLFPNEPTFIMPYTDKSNPNQLQFLYSQDGLRWNVAEVQVRMNGVTDFSILQEHDSLFHLVYANGAHSQSLSYATSSNLTDWSEAIELPVMKQITEVTHCLYPDLFKQGKDYFVMWTSAKISGSGNTNTANQLYLSNSKDIKTTSKPMVCLPSAQPMSQSVLYQKYLFYIKEDPDNDVFNIEMSQVKSLKKATFGLPKMVVSDKEMGTPVVAKIGKYIYLYWKVLETGKIKALRTKNLKKGDWEEISDMIFIPSNIQMGGILKVDDDFLTKLANPNR